MLIGLCGFLVASQRVVGQAEIAKKRNVFRAQRKSLTYRFDCQVGTAHLKGNDAQEMMRIRMVGIDLQHLTTNLLGLIKLACLMALESERNASATVIMANPLQEPGRE